MHYVPCSNCSRYVKEQASACPFCSQSQSPTLHDDVDAVVMDQFRKLGRAAALVLSASLSAAACGTNSSESTQQAQGSSGGPQVIVQQNAHNASTDPVAVHPVDSQPVETHPVVVVRPVETHPTVIAPPYGLPPGTYPQRPAPVQPRNPADPTTVAAYGMPPPSSPVAPK